MTGKGKLISRKIDKAIFENNMIEANDRILLAVSGGKDSMSMAYFLGRKQHKFRVPFSVEALHIKTDFCGCCSHSRMDDFFREWDVKLHYLTVPVLERLKPGRKMNCYWCATQRRKELMEFARTNGFTKIALGHHLDDILETFFMNMVLKSEMSTMLPILKYDHYDNTVIRPLARVQEHEIISFAGEMGLTDVVTPCPYGTNSKRIDMRNLINAMADQEGDHIRDNIYNAMMNINPRYLPKQTG